ncbi:MAG: hypothetical protein K2O97_05495 [Acetatifactor sp.]|nr:hypothetical protein [Acetatifactor sp.]
MTDYRCDGMNSGCWYTPIPYDLKIYMWQRSVAADMTAAARSEVKAVYSYGSVDLTLPEGYPEPGFSPRKFVTVGNMDESISFLMTFCRCE